MHLPRDAQAFSSCMKTLCCAPGWSQRCDSTRTSTSISRRRRAASRPASVDVVIADYQHGLRLADGEQRAALGIREARVLVLTANDREVDVRRAVEAGVYGYLLAGGP
jgi:DNA-binding NarL/FixJ family response regulator